MPTLTESEITSRFIGKPVSMERLSKCTQRNGMSQNPAIYIAYSCGFLYKQELRELFGVTDELKEMWERKGIDFNVCIHLIEDKIVFCGIDKYHESDGARPSCRTLKCTQQDLRIALSILQYICEIGNREGD